MITSVVSVTYLDLDQSGTAQQRENLAHGKKKEEKKTKLGQNYLCSLQ